MSYTGIHRQSVQGRIGRLVSSIVEFAVVLWLASWAFGHMRSAPNILQFEAALAGFLLLAIVLHESGHLLVGLAGGEPVRKMRIGSGPTLFAFRLGGLPVQVCLNLLGGGAVYFSRTGAGPARRRLASLLAGPLANLIAGLYAPLLYLYTGEEWLWVFALANAVCFLTSAVPSTSRVGGVEHPSDGMQILRLLVHPDDASDEVPNFLSAVMTDDARDVLVRAAEDAVLSSSEEVTEESLLRALRQDAVVGDLLESSGLSARIPPPPMAESDTAASPHFSTSVRAAFANGEKEARKLGFDRLTAPSILLGLFVTDCAASRLMRESGITEDAVRKLASVVRQDDEETRMKRVLSPDLPLERWGTAADKALAYAYRVAVADASSVVGTQHLLAALVADPSCRAAQVLTKLGFVLEWKPARSEDDKDSADDTQGKGPVVSAELKLALAGAVWRTGPSLPTGTAELCLGIVDQNAGEGAALLIAAGATVRAIESALRATPREPSYPAGCNGASRWLWMLRGSAREKAGRWSEARADFALVDRAAAAESEHALCRNNMAWAALMSGDPALRAESLELTRFAVSVSPDNDAFAGTHAFALLENGQAGEAASLLESIMPRVTRPAGRAYDLCELAMCYARLNQRDAASRNLAAASEADPGCMLLPRARAELGAVAA